MSIVTLFQYPKKVISSQPLITFISRIKRGNYEDMIDRYRDMYHRKLDTIFDSQRRQIPRFSIAGNFKSDNYNLKLISYSQYLFFEITYLHPRDFEYVRIMLQKNPYVFASFKNALGHGICFIVKTDTDLENHSKAFNRAHRYFSKKLKTKRLSKDGDNIQHLCLVSHDPDLQLNIACIPFPLRAQIKY